MELFLQRAQEEENPTGTSVQTKNGPAPLCVQMKIEIYQSIRKWSVCCD